MTSYWVSWLERTVFPTSHLTAHESKVTGVLSEPRMCQYIPNPDRSSPLEALHLFVPTSPDTMPVWSLDITPPPALPIEYHVNLGMEALPSDIPGTWITA